MNNIRYQALFTPQPEGGYTVTFPDIPEAITEGDNMEAATFAASEALTLALECMLEAGDRIPDSREHADGIWVSPCASVQAAAALRRARLAQGKSVSDMARALHTSWPAAQRLESPRANPTLRQPHSAPTRTRGGGNGAAVVSWAGTGGLMQIPRTKSRVGTGHCWPIPP